jgi:hypothetical protein
MLPWQTLLPYDLPMDSHCALTLDKAYLKCNAMFQRYAEAHADMVWHQVPYYRLYSSLPAHFPQHSPHVLVEFATQLPVAVLWDDHHRVSTLALHVGETQPLVHWFLLLFFHWTSPVGRTYFIASSIGRIYPGYSPEVDSLVTTRNGIRFLIKVFEIG